MTQNMQHEDTGSATSHSKRKSRLSHWIRIVVMFLSGGFIFPHAMTEDDDDTKY